MSDNIIQTPESAITVDNGRKEKLIGMKKAYSRCGIALCAVSVFLFLISLILGIVLKTATDGFKEFYSKYPLYINEALIAVALAVGLCTLIKTSGTAPTGERIGKGKFFKLMCICFAIGWVGNLIGTVLLLVWNVATGSEVVNQLTGVILNTEPIQMLVCTGILAPILEEFFFRKVLIDRTHKYGELTAILISAAFFGLFHQNFSQFFYAFGLGIIFGYVYCKTGSYLTVTLMHVTFNTVMGVIPGLLLPRVLEFIGKIESIDMSALDDIIPLVSEYGIAVAIYMLYAMLIGAINIAGAIILFINFKKSSFRNAAPELTAPEKRRAAILNPGTIAAAAVLIALTVATLFI